MAKFRNTGTETQPIDSFETRVLVHLSVNGTSSTKELRDFLNYSNQNAFERLTELERVGVVTSTKPEEECHWSLNLSQLDRNSISNDRIHQQHSKLLSEIINQVSNRYISNNERIQQYPAIQSWLNQRGVDSTYPQLTYSYRIAIYRRFLQATLYGLHQSEHASLEQLTETTDWQSAFKQAYEVIGDHGFQQSPVDSLLQEDKVVSRLALSLRHLLLRDPQPANTLAEVYEKLTSQETRRDLGQFATPVYLGEFMASWSVQNPDDTVLDPGIGAGQLASQALFKKLEMGSEDPLEDIVGIDIDEVSIAMSSTALKLIDGNGSPKLEKQDFVSHHPTTSTKSGEIKEVYDAVVANPPYSRHQALDSKFKGDIHNIVTKETGYDFSRRTPLYAYFIAHAAQFVQTGSRLAFLLPSKFMDTKFGRVLKKLLLNEFRIHAILQLEDDIPVFEGVRTRPSILLLESGSPPKSHQTKFIKLAEWPDIDSPSKILDQNDATELDGVEFKTTIAQELISPTERWTHYFDAVEVDSLPQLARFEEIASIKRGIATGKNDYFCLSADDLKEYPIPEKFRHRILRTARGMDAVSVNMDDWHLWEENGDEVWLLYCYNEKGVIERHNIRNDPTERYLKEGDNRGVTDGYLVSNREPWYKVEDRNPTPILGKYMNRHGFHFMRNDANLLTLNNVHNIAPRFGYEDEQLNALLAYLNSKLFERQLVKLSHDYNGLQKIEIGHLESAPVIDPRELSSSRCSRLSSLFEDLDKARRNGNNDEGILLEIDEELQNFLDIHEVSE